MPGMPETPRDPQRTRLVTEAARLYYEFDHTQEDIARRLRISRSSVSRLLKEAKQSGIVQVRVCDPLTTSSELELEFEKTFGLKKAIVVPIQTSLDPLTAVAPAAVDYLSLLLVDDDIVGVSWGATLLAMADYLAEQPQQRLRGVKVVQVKGSVAGYPKATHAAEIAMGFARAFNGEVVLLPVPVIVDSPEAKEIIEADRGIRSVLNLGRKARVAVFGIGYPSDDAMLVEAGFLTTKQMDELRKKGAVGDIYARYFDTNGVLCDASLDQRIVGLPLAELRRKEFSLGVAAGKHKARAIVGALRGRYLNVLITDEPTALEVLKITKNLCDRPLDDISRSDEANERLPLSAV